MICDGNISIWRIQNVRFKYFSLRVALILLWNLKNWSIWGTQIIIRVKREIWLGLFNCAVTPTKASQVIEMPTPSHLPVSQTYHRFLRWLITWGRHKIYQVNLVKNLFPKKAISFHPLLAIQSCQLHPSTLGKLTWPQFSVSARKPPHNITRLHSVDTPDQFFYILARKKRILITLPV